MLVFAPVCLLLLAELSTNVVGFEVNVYFDSQQSRHRDHGWMFHPEHPARIAVCVDAIRPLLQANDQRLRLIDIAPLADNAEKDQHHNQPVTDEELDYARSLLMQTHNPKLLTCVAMIHCVLCPTTAGRPTYRCKWLFQILGI